MSGLIRGEIYLTLDIIAGLFIGGLIIRTGLAEKIMSRIIPRNIPSVTGLAVALSAGSSRTGAAVIASALAQGTITERIAVWSVLMLPLPAYLRRWPSTFALSVSMAGGAGAMFAVSLLVRSVLRFMIALRFVRREGANSCEARKVIPSHSHSSLSLLRRLVKSLPVAWVMFAVSYSLSPIINSYFQEAFRNHDAIIPLAGWGVAAGGVVNVSAALALAGGAMASGELDMWEAFFALVLGSGLGTAVRVLRQDMGYYFGLFPSRVAGKMLMMNLATIIPLVCVNVIIAWVILILRV